MTLSTLFNALMWAWAASELLVALKTHTRRSAGDVQDRGSLLILWPVIVASIYLGTWFGDGHPHTIFGGPPWVRIAAFALLLMGLLIRWTAILTLGRSFSVNVAIRTTQTLHRTGIFRIVRHPSYSGLLLVFAAIGLETRNWTGLAILLIPTTAAVLYRIHVEELALRRAFGGQYDDYCRATKRLVPGVY